MENRATVKECAIIRLNRITSDRGALTSIQGNDSIPFKIKRVYHTYDIPTDAYRGGHSHIEQHEFVMAVSGSFSIILDDGKERRTVFLNKPYEGLHILPGIWRELQDFSSGSVVLVMASDVYNEADYIREYQAYKKSR